MHIMYVCMLDLLTILQVISISMFTSSCIISSRSVSIKHILLLVMLIEIADSVCPCVLLLHYVMLCYVI